MQDSQKQHTTKRYATAAIIIGGGAVLGSAALMANYPSDNHGKSISYNGQQYYIPGDSKRAVYPTREACLRDVPPRLQSECEPVSNYAGGSGSGWYGPVYSPRDNSGYRPSSQFPTETASSSNVGKQLPSGANTTGFGANGKALTGSSGG